MPEEVHPIDVLASSNSDLPVPLLLHHHGNAKGVVSATEAGFLLTAAGHNNAAVALLS